MRNLVAALFFIAVLGMLAPPVLAQAPAPAPAPKVTINGLVDFVATVYSNWSGGGGTGSPSSFLNPAIVNITDDRDKGWYTRERGIFTITGEVGRSRGVWSFELDFTNGAGVVGNAGNAYNSTFGNMGASFPGTSANFDMDIDVASVVETKWLYIETPATGVGSFLPWIPFDSIIRVGGQPARGHDYKVGIQLSGDFAGGNLTTNWTPDIRSTLTYVQIGAKLDPLVAPGANNNWAVAASLEMDVFKGLTVKPTYTYANYFGGQCGASNLGWPAVGGYNPNAGCLSVLNATLPTPTNPPILNGAPLKTWRHTIGGDVRWVIGGVSLQPTFLYQIGEGTRYRGPVNPLTGFPVPVIGNNNGTAGYDISAFIFDTIAGYRIGPLNLQARLMYTSGQAAQFQVNNGANVNYYTPINSGFSYMSGWSDIQTGGIDYITALNAGTASMTIRESPSYDKYGRIFLGFASDYALTPALTFTGLLNVSWTPYKVNTDSIQTITGLVPCPAVVTPGSAFGPCTSDGRGTEQYLGTETALGMTYRFAPNIALDLIGSYLWAGAARNNAGGSTIGVATGTPTVPAPRALEADDVWKVSTRLRFTF